MGGILYQEPSYFLDAPLARFFPGAAIMLLSLSFNLVGRRFARYAGSHPKGTGLMVFFLAKRLTNLSSFYFGVTLITFCLSFLMQADPVRMIAGRSATQQRWNRSARNSGSINRCPYDVLNTSAVWCREIWVDPTAKKPRSAN